MLIKIDNSQIQSREILTMVTELKFKSSCNDYQKKNSIVSLVIDKW